MCIAIYLPEGKSLSQRRLMDSYNANPDGLGIVSVFPEYRHEIFSTKGCMSFERFYKKFFIHTTAFKTIVHFRTASSGKIGDKFCHPFFVNDDLAFVQNGNLYEFSNYMPGRNDNKTDIQRFNDEVLKRLPDGFLHIPEIRLELEKYNKECFSKMIFMDSDGTVDIINEAAGVRRDGVWFSNGGIENYTGYGYSGAYYYNPGDVRHKGGLISAQMFDEKRRKRWKQCDNCLGYFRHEQLSNGKCNGCNTLTELLKFCGGS